MEKYEKLLEKILKLLGGLDEEIEDIEFIEEPQEFNDFENPIIIPPNIYKKICKELKSETIDFMGIS